MAIENGLPRRKNIFLRQGEPILADAMVRAGGHDLLLSIKRFFSVGPMITATVSTTRIRLVVF